MAYDVEVVNKKLDDKYFGAYSCWEKVPKDKYSFIGRRIPKYGDYIIIINPSDYPYYDKQLSGHWKFVFLENAKDKNYWTPCYEVKDLNNTDDEEVDKHIPESEIFKNIIININSLLNKSKCSTHEKDCKLINDIITKTGYRFVRSCYNCKYLVCSVGDNLKCSYIADMYRTRSNNDKSEIAFFAKDIASSSHTVCDNHKLDDMYNTYEKMISHSRMSIIDTTNRIDIKLSPLWIDKE